MKKFILIIIISTIFSSVCQAFNYKIEKLLSFPENRQIFTASIKVSSKGPCFIAFAAKDKNNNFYIYTNKKAYGPFYGILKGTPFINNGALVFAEIAKDEKIRIVESSGEHQWYEKIKILSYSENKILYIAEDKNSQRLVLNGKVLKTFDKILYNKNLFLTKSGKKVLYVAVKNQTFYLMLNNHELYQSNEKVSFSSPVISDDQKDFCVTIKSNKGYKIITDNKVSKNYAGIFNPGFTKDNKLFYVSMENKKFKVHIDKYVSEAFDMAGYPVFSDSGKSFAYAANLKSNWFIVKNNEKGGYYDNLGPYTFAPNTEDLYYTAIINNMKSIVKFGSKDKIKFYNNTGIPFFSETGKAGFIAENNNKFYLTWMDRVSKGYNKIENPTILNNSDIFALVTNKTNETGLFNNFSQPDNYYQAAFDLVKLKNNIVFKAKDNKGWFLNINKKDAGFRVKGFFKNSLPYSDDKEVLKIPALNKNNEVVLVKIDLNS